jgi:hypothetical protein
MDFRRTSYSLTALLCLLSVAAARGQTVRGSISGNVQDASGAAVPGCTVHVALNVKGAVTVYAGTTSQSSGEFVFRDLQPGTYTVTISHDSFQTEIINNVEVQAAKVTSLPVTLRSAPPVLLKGQDQKVRLSLTPSSNVPSSEIGKTLDTRCPDVLISVDPSKADYLLEAIYTGAGAARQPYKFTLFNSAGDRVFSTETARAASAVKDVCGFIRKTVH